MRTKILFVCTVNRMRSLTASTIYADDERFEVKSAGTDKHANQVLTEELLNWADYVIVMEKHHRNKIQSRFPKIYSLKPIICLYIPDEYDFMQSELIGALRHKFEFIYERDIAPVSLRVGGLFGDNQQAARSGEQPNRAGV